MTVIRTLLIICGFFLLPAAQQDFEIKQTGGCQGDRDLPVQTTVEFFINPVEFDRTIEYKNFVTLTDKKIDRWRFDNNIAAYWIPEGHYEGGHVIVSGLSYEYQTKRYTKPFDMGAYTACSFFSDVDLKVTLHTTVMIAKSLSEDRCLYPVYMKHMRKHRDIEEGVFKKEMQVFLEKDIYDVVAYGEGDEFVLNKEWNIKPHQQRQSVNLERGINAYIRSVAGEMEYQSSRFDLGEELIALDQAVKACK